MLPHVSMRLTRGTHGLIIFAYSKHLIERLFSESKKYRPMTRSEDLDAMLTYPPSIATGIAFLCDSVMLTLSNATVKAVIIAKQYELIAEYGVVDASGGRNATIATMEPDKTVEDACSDNAMMEFHRAKKQILLDAGITVGDALGDDLITGFNLGR
jgi:hypothetical protein